jgi:shikimate dehydrogenase
MPRVGVLGWPVAHSRSPAIHNAAFAALGMSDWRYQLLPVPPELFSEIARALRGSGFRGANVTIPHKRAALALADEVSVPAGAIGATNTLTFAEDGTIAAENTDAPGLITALGESPGGLRALVLGAGGSARAAAWALREAGASDVAVWNRTPERARELARDLGVRAVSDPEPADLLINCTSVGLERSAAGPRRRPGAAARPSPAEPPAADQSETLSQLGLTFERVGEYAYVVDLVYGARAPTALLAAAAQHGSRTLDGLEILLAQGAASFELWTGREAPLRAMRAALREIPTADAD